MASSRHGAGPTSLRSSSYGGPPQLGEGGRDRPYSIASSWRISGARHLRHGLLHRVCTDVLDVGHDRPLVAEGILESCIAITVELIGGFLHRARACAQRLVVGGVAILDKDRQ